MENKENWQRPTDEELFETLCLFLGVDKEDVEKRKEIKFEQFQKETIDKILAHEDVLSVVPTGGGKSFCYQISAMHLPGVTLVVSPLLALIENQVTALREIKYSEHELFPVACLTSSFLADRHNKEFYYYDKSEKSADSETEASKKIIKRILLDAYNGKYKLLYITPERLRMPMFVQFAKKAKISMIAVDEAHCISLWGYEFRKQYLRIPVFLNKIAQRPIIAAFTATATKPVREDIVKLLKMNNCEASAGEGNLKKRDNLIFDVYDMSAKTPSAQARKKNDFLVKYLREHKNERGYIYCSTSESVNKVYERLKREKDLSFTRYYSQIDEAIKRQGLEGKSSEVNFDPDESKKNNFESFKSGEKKIMIATNALGMGIDIKDIQFVIHYNMPLCLENYYQEAGRAGRSKGADGEERQKADCILLYSQKDTATCKMLIGSSIKNSELSKTDKNARNKIAMNRLQKMKEYVRLAGDMGGDASPEQKSNVLQDWIIDYFNNYDPSEDEQYKNQAETKNEDEAEVKAPKAEKMDVYSEIRLPEVLFSNRTRIAQELRKGIMLTEKPLLVGLKQKKTDLDKDKTKKANATDEVTASDDEPKRISVRYKVTVNGDEAKNNSFTYFDMMVADAVYTLMYYGFSTICARNIMTLLTGNQNIRPRSERTREIEQSIEKMMNAYIVIDMEGSSEYGFEYGERRPMVIEGKFLPLRKKAGRGYIRDDGDRISVAPLYRYAERLNGQFFIIPTKLLCFDENEPKPDFSQKSTLVPSKDDFMERRIKIYKFLPKSPSDAYEIKPNRIKPKLRRRSIAPQSKINPGTPENPLLPERFMPTKENLALLHYLICRIDIMPRLYEKSKTHSASNIIRFDTLLNTLNIEMGKDLYLKRRKADELWKWIVVILRHFKSLGYIEDYELIIKNNP